MPNKINKKLGAWVRGSGVDFTVWAPFAKNVAVKGDFSNWSPLNMTGYPNGYWSTFIRKAEVGQAYKYVITTQDDRLLERNDPRARQLTDSDQGSSVIVENDFDWEDTSYVAPPKDQQVIYEMHIGTFNRPDASTPGNFYTAIEKLDYLKKLGINMIELMPVTSMATSYGWGYAPNYIFSVEDIYGGRHGMLEFIKACHQKDIGVILDVVYNHFFPKTDLWQFDGWSANNRGGIYFYNDERGDTPWGGRPDFGRPEVRQFITENVAMWFSEYRLDGLRVDSTIYMRNTQGHNNDPAHDIADAWSLLGEITKVAHSINPNAVLIAEDCAGNDYITKPQENGGAGFDAQWELGFPHAIRHAFGIYTTDNKPTLSGIKYELNHNYNGNPFAQVIFSDSHDTAANGSVRINEASSPGNGDGAIARQQTLLANVITLTAPGIPMLLQGQEFMQDGNFNDWQALDWDKTEQFAGIVLANQHLGALRHNYYNNTAGLLSPNINAFHIDTNNNVIAYHRWLDGGVNDDTIVIANFNKKAMTNYDITFPVSGHWRVRFNSSWKGYSNDLKEIAVDYIDSQAKNGNKVTLHLPSYGAFILSREN